MLHATTTRLSIATALVLTASVSLAAKVPVDITNVNNGLTSISSVTFDPPHALTPCGGGSSTYCTFFGGDPSATRNVKVTPNPSGAVNSVPGGIGPTGFPAAMIPASGSYLDLTLSAGNTLLTLGVSAATFSVVDICIDSDPLVLLGDCAQLNAHVVGGGVVFNPTGPVNGGAFTPAGGGSTGATVPVDGSGKAVFMVQNAATIVADFSKFSQVVTTCTGTACALITGNILNLDMVRYVLEIDYDPTFTSYTANFIGQSGNNSFVFLTLDTAAPGGDQDGDGVADTIDNCSAIANTDQANSDGDGRGNVCDNCPAVSNTAVGYVPGSLGFFPRGELNNQRDTDGDGTGDACDTDDDGDTVLDGVDNCPVYANPLQENADGDTYGDVCDNCRAVTNTAAGDVPGTAPAVAKTQLDSDGDGYGNRCDGDINNNPNPVGNVNTTDYTVFRSVINKAYTFSSNAARSDLNGSGTVDTTDYTIFRTLINKVPGPSGFCGTAVLAPPVLCPPP